MDGMPQGKALDMQQPRRCGTRARSRGRRRLAGVQGADLVIMTAGFPRKPGMSRTDLLKANADIIRPAAEAVKKHAPNATVVVVTNPLDVMTWLFWKVSRLPEAPRGRHGRHPRLDALPRSSSAMELGVLGRPTCRRWCWADTATRWFPLPRYTTVGGIAISRADPG
jgi:malate dehydrogenase